jgi:hypothetical protein
MASCFGGARNSAAITGGFELSVIDFFRLLKKDEPFFANVGGAGCGLSLCPELAVCGTLGIDLSWEAM